MLIKKKAVAKIQKLRLENEQLRPTKPSEMEADACQSGAPTAPGTIYTTISPVSEGKRLKATLPTPDPPTQLPSAQSHLETVGVDGQPTPATNGKMNHRRADVRDKDPVNGKKSRKRSRPHSAAKNLVITDESEDSDNFIPSDKEENENPNLPKNARKTTQPKTSAKKFAALSHGIPVPLPEPNRRLYAPQVCSLGVV